MQVIKKTLLVSFLALIALPIQEISASSLLNYFSGYFFEHSVPALNYPKHYSINLMWINKKYSQDDSYIYPISQGKDLANQFLSATFEWASLNPEATVNVWLDSLLTPQEAIKNTQAYIDAESKRVAIRIELKDIRDLKRVKNNTEIFSSNLPVYFRADLLRAIVAEEMIKQNKDSCFVYADYDVKPLSKPQLFDQKTLAHLRKYNFVMAHEANKLGFENSFQIVTFNEQLLKALKLMVIKANIMRAHSFLEDIKEQADPISPLHIPKVWKTHEVGFQENIFYSYPLMYSYLCQLRAIGSPLLLSGSTKPYDKTVDGIQVLNGNAKIIMSKSTAITHLSNFPMPTKQISIPESTSGYLTLN
jgi:hypothetical protein